MNRVLILLELVLLGTPVLAQETFEPKHPYSDYSGISEFEIMAMVEQVRASRPQILRGGWELDRLLRRYIDEGRKESGALEVLHGYFMSILDRYEEAVRKGEGEEFNLLPGHRAWGAAGRVRIYEELVRQGRLFR